MLEKELTHTSQFIEIKANQQTIVHAPIMDSFRTSSSFKEEEEELRYQLREDEGRKRMQEAV